MEDFELRESLTRPRWKYSTDGRSVDMTEWSTLGTSHEKQMCAGASAVALCVQPQGHLANQARSCQLLDLTSRARCPTVRRSRSQQAALRCSQTYRRFPQKGAVGCYNCFRQIEAPQMCIQQAAKRQGRHGSPLEATTCLYLLRFGQCESLGLGAQLRQGCSLRSCSHG